MQPTNQLLGVQFRMEIRLVTNAVSHETLLISDFLSHNNIVQWCILGCIHAPKGRKRSNEILSLTVGTVGAWRIISNAISYFKLNQ